MGVYGPGPVRRGAECDANKPTPRDPAVMRRFNSEITGKTIRRTRSGEEGKGARGDAGALPTRRDAADGICIMDVSTV